MKKFKPLTCAIAAIAVAALAIYVSAQKRSGDARANAAGDATATQETNAQRAAATRREATAHPDCPLKGGGQTSGGDESSAGHAGAHDAHLAAVNARGEKAMGFSQTETTHHFILDAGGGVIQVEADDPNDAPNRERIRQHLAHIARAFAAGDFDTPMLVHGRVPPGVPVMRRLKSEISYAYEETAGGARVRIMTKNAEALAAVQDFLRFQITDHQTGDPLEVK